MIEISEELREMYHSSSVPKQLYIVFPNVTLNNSKVFEFSFEESLSSDTDMLFGSCEATQFRARVEGVGKDIVGQKCRIYHTVDSKYEMPLGTYIIDSVSKKDDLGYREIIGYDEIYTKLSVDVTAWYKSLAFPMPLKTLRQSLFGYTGIPIVDQELIQDDLEIERTIEPQTLTGRDVAQKIGEINGTFGHIGRDGKFRYVHLGSTGLYPAEDLYPFEELFPAEADSIFESSTVFSCTREEYEVSGIDCLQIRQQEGDVGAVIFDSRNYSNPYIVNGNFLVYGKTAVQLEEIARKLFNYIKNTPYTPYTAKVIGLPYLEVGDGITFTTKKDNFLSFVMKRKFSGIQSLKDEFSATGNQRRDNEVSPNMEIEMLKGRSTVIQKSVEGIKVTVTNLESDTNSKFEQTDRKIAAEVASINKDMSSRFEITSKAIDAEVKRATSAEGELSGKISVEADRITAEVKRAIGAEGELSTKIVQTDTKITTKVDGLSSSFSELSQTVDGWTFTTEDGEVKINGGYIGGGLIEGSWVYTKGVELSDKSVNINKFEVDEDGVIIGTSSGELTAGLLDQYGSSGYEYDATNTFNVLVHADYMTIGDIRKGYTYAYYWYNRGMYDINGYSERHIFLGKVRFIDNISTSRMALSDTASLYATDSGIETQSSIASNGNIVCTGTKNRAVETQNHGIVLMNALETAGAYFSDIGSGVIIDGVCYIYPDDIFEETIDINSECHVFITQTSTRKIDHVEKQKGYFIVYGEEGASFDWIMIAKQKGYQLERMEAGQRIVDNEIEFDDSVFRRDYDAANAAEKYADEYERDLERELLEDISNIKNKRIKSAEGLLL